MEDLINNLKKKNNDWKVNTIYPFLDKKEKILDYGCGDLSFATSLKEKNPKLQVTGVDVVDFNNRPKNISFRLYRGEKLPFKNNEFDTVIALYVFHHCRDAESAFKECMRVGKRVLIIESLPRNRLELPLVKLMDWFYNVIKPEPIPLTYQFQSKKGWEMIFKRNKAKLKKIKDIKTSSLPIIAIGRQCILEVKKIK